SKATRSELLNSCPTRSEVNDWRSSFPSASQIEPKIATATTSTAAMVTLSTTLNTRRRGADDDSSPAACMSARVLDDGRFAWSAGTCAVGTVCASLSFGGDQAGTSDWVAAAWAKGIVPLPAPRPDGWVGDDFCCGGGGAAAGGWPPPNSSDAAGTGACLKRSA